MGRKNKRKGRGGRENNDDGDEQDGPEQKRPRLENQSNDLHKNGGVYLSKFDLKNENFEKYYKEMPFVSSEEYSTFIEIMRSDLPSTFRVNESSPFASVVKRKLLEFQQTLTDLRVTRRDSEDVVDVDPPAPLPWYPLHLSGDGNPTAWGISMAKRQMKKASGLEKFRAFLVQMNDLGAITRQEAVSMLPPLFMDVQSHHYILDMCAAPGSKTSQLVEMLHRNSDGSRCVNPSGLVIANDVDKNRSFLLDHQLKRLGSPNVVVTNYQAQRFPELEKVRYDRILCDVPCSGDGTFRKNPDAWAKWTPMNGTGLHGVQLSIAFRAFQLLEVGGRLVYSTCSLNPVEDEAVVAELLRKTKGCLRLVDVSGQLPNLKRRPGLSSWKGFMDIEGNWYESHASMPKQLSHKVSGTVFPPTKEDAEKFQLHRAMRIMPNDQDTGGFFVAVLEKVSEMEDPRASNHHAPPSQAEEAAAEAQGDVPIQEVESDVREKKQTRWQQRGNKADDGEFETGAEGLQGFSNHAQLSKQWAMFRGFLNMDPNFPQQNLMVRVGTGVAGSSEKMPKNRDQVPGRVLYMSDAVHDIVVDPRNQTLKLINVGLPVLMSQKATMFGLQYRLAQEAIPSFYPFIRSRVIAISLEDLKVVLTETDPYLTKLTAASQEVLRPLEPGPCVLVFKDSSSNAAIAELVCSANRNQFSIRVQMKDTEKKLLYQLFVGDDALKEDTGSDQAKDAQPLDDPMNVEEKEGEGEETKEVEVV